MSSLLVEMSNPGRSLVGHGPSYIRCLALSIKHFLQMVEFCSIKNANRQGVSIGVQLLSKYPSALPDLVGIASVDPNPFFEIDLDTLRASVVQQEAIIMPQLKED